MNGTSSVVRMAVIAFGVLLAAALAFQIVGWVLGFLVSTVVLALRLAVIAALVGGGVWAYRRLSGDSRRSLGRGRGY